MLNSKGFTFLEIMGIIVILGILASFGTWTVLKLINSSSEVARKKAEEAIHDAAKSYALENDLYFKPCEDEETTECEHEIITVNSLIEKKYLEIKSDSCKKDGEILIYMDKSYNFQTEFVTENICK